MDAYWLNETGEIFLILSGILAAMIAVDILRGRRQKMRVMNFVWPITALWSGPAGFYVYWTIGRQPHDEEQGQHNGRGGKPFWHSVLAGTSHCGAGCTAGDLAGEWIVFLGDFTISGSVLWANYAVDFACAYLAGIVFQYYSIATAYPANWWLIRKGLKEAM